MIIILLILLLVGEVWADEISDLIPILIQIESSGRSWVTSKDGCRGLCQLSELAWKDVMDIPYLPNVYNPKLNVIAGEKYLRLIKKMLGKDYTITNMLICYNWGIGNFRKYQKGEKSLPRETKVYLKKILREMNSDTEGG